MNWTKIKKLNDVKLEGVTFSWEKNDGTVKSVTLTDSKGNKIHITELYLGLAVSIPSPPETIKKFKLSGVVLEVPVELLFDSEYDAKSKLRDFERELNDTQASTFKVEEVEVVVEE